MRRRYARIFDKELQYGQAWQDYKSSNSLKNKLCKCGSPAKQRHHVIQARRVSSHAEANIEYVCDDCHTALHPHLQRKRKFL